MKWTTSWASAASNAPSGNGSSSAEACRTSTPGCRARAAATNGSDGSTAATAVAPEARDELGRQGAGTAADVERALAGVDPREVRELRREEHRVATHEAVVGVGGDIEAHSSESTQGLPVVAGGTSTIGRP